MWLKRTSVTFKALFEKVTRKKLADDMKHCATFLHTGALENYHNVRLKYLPKRIHFGRATTVIRSMLATIETNRNVITDKPDKPKMYARYSKASAQWVLKKKSAKKDYSYRHEVVENIMNNVRIGRNEEVDMSEYIPSDLPKNIAPVPRPSMDELLAKHRSRMAMSENQI